MDGELVATEVEGLFAGELPEDGEVGDEGDAFCDEGAHELQALAGKQGDVFGDALVGVVRLAAKLQAVVFVLCQPGALELLAHLLAPVDDEAFAQPFAGVHPSDDEAEVAEVFDDQRGQDGAVHVVQGVVETFVPLHDPDADEDEDEGAGGVGGEQRPGNAVVAVEPVGGDEAEEAAEGLHGGGGGGGFWIVRRYAGRRKAAKSAPWGAWLCGYGAVVFLRSSSRRLMSSAGSPRARSLSIAASLPRRRDSR